MGKEAQDRDLELSAEARTKFDELVALLSKHGFGEEGPPLETTFAPIEQFGHQAGRMLARAIDAKLAEEHANHFSDEQACPGCGQGALREDLPHELPLRTPDGEVVLNEPAFRCPQCQRDFFPGAHPVTD